MTALFSIIGVGYLMGVYRMVPVMAMVIGLSFAFYGAVKKVCIWMQDFPCLQRPYL